MILRSPQDATLYLDEDMAHVETHTAACGVAAIYSSRSPVKTTPNEDAAAIIPYDDKSAVLVVADGMGGGRAGEHASRQAVTSMHATLRKAAADGSELRSAILDAIEKANAAVMDKGIGAATTLAAVEIAGGTARPYHVGDSMILVTGQRGKIKLQTVCHSPVGFAVEAGLLTERDAIHHEDRHIVSNIIGMANMRIEIGSPIELAAHDTLILASDGLFDNLHLEEIVQMLRTGPITDATMKIAQAAHDRMTHPADGQPSKPDDLTFIAYRRS
ncbi:MAG: SpoIIE family protein phosphatase [Planctomycetes bacterium]|nr:SpoIIE family protein phosphatase [Planctomycetota bacterium]